MSRIAVQIGPGDRINIQCDEQHISRITHREARDLILQLLAFGGKQIRDEVATWITGDAPVVKIAEYFEEIKVVDGR